MKQLPENCVDAIVTDIPYGEVNRKSNGLRCLDKGLADIETVSSLDMSIEFCRISRGSIYVFCGAKHINEIREIFICNELSTRFIVWEKTNPSPMNGEHIWLSSIEWCVFGKKQGATYNGFCRSVVLRHPSGKSNIHKTEKPISLMKDLIVTSTNKDDIILDPFAGSGTTLVAAKELGRQFLGFEIEPKYVEIAQRRLAQEVFAF